MLKRITAMMVMLALMILLVTPAMDVAAYETVIPEVGHYTQELEQISPPNDTGAVPLGYVYISREEAVEQIRQHMEDREDYVQVSIKHSGYPTEEILKEMMEDAMDHTGKPTEGDYLLWQFESWEATTHSSIYPSYYGLDYHIHMKYYTTAKQEKKVDKEVKKILSELDVDDKSDYEKVRAVYDYICKNVTYDYDNLEKPTYLLKHTAYAALVDKTAVCQGYALAIYRLLLELGVDNRIIVGTSGNENHAWNIVKLDGVYYNLDATWDAGASEYQYFLRCNENFPDHDRNKDYETVEFHKDYPMSSADYGEEGGGVAEDLISQGTCGENAKWKLRTDGTLIIYGSGATADYPYGSNNPNLLAPWKPWNDEIKKVIVEEGITALGEHNLMKLSEVKSITLPSTLLKLGDYCFAESEFEKITLPDSLQELGCGVFKDCTKLKSIVIPDSVTAMDMNCFRGCSALEKATIGDGLTEIPTQTFYDCYELKQVEMGAVTVLGYRAFSGCGFESFVIPKTVTTLGEEALNSCRWLKKIVIPATVTNIGINCFWGCERMTEVVFEGTPQIERTIFRACYELEKITFCADPPKMDDEFSSWMTLTCYYPADNPAWTDEVLRDYEGNITWVEMKCTEGHTPVEDAGYDATCTTEGLTDGSHCAVCGEVIEKQKVISVKDHDYGKWVTVKEPTEEEEGRKEKTCSVCGDVKSKSIDKLEPAPTEPAPTEPAPTEPAPTEPAPTEPAPTEPAPTEPAPTEPAPTEPAPTEPAPTKPAPTEPDPTEPAPTQPAGTEPEHTEPAPSAPAPTEEPMPAPTKGPGGIVIVVIALILIGSVATFVVLKKKK